MQHVISRRLYVLNVEIYVTTALKENNFGTRPISGKIANEVHYCPV